MWALLGFLILTSLALAQYPPSPENVTVVKTKLGNGAKITYREPGICETTPDVRSYSGYITLPPGSLRDAGMNNRYEINLFFWYFRARKNAESAPLALWLTGGPGASSLKGVFQENGPCFVNSDSRTTRLNSWSWNREVNMLYIDQPVQSGLSYDTLRNGSIDLFQDRLGPRIFVPNFRRPSPRNPSPTNLAGTFPSNLRSQTSNTTANAAKVLWMAMQVFLSDFQPHRTIDDRVNLWTESYGGHYGPVTAALWMRMNDRISPPPNENIPAPLKGNYRVIRTDSLGILAGCIDPLVEGTTGALFAYNNTYGVKLINETQLQRAQGSWGRCMASIQRCRQLQTSLDPDNKGHNSQVNQACQSTFQVCSPGVDFSGSKSVYDIAAPAEESYPPFYMLGYLAQQDVQKALGARVNYTEVMESVNQVFTTTGDKFRTGPLEDIGRLLDKGVKVAMVYGDRDMSCNWFGGEAVSLATKWQEQEAFRAAGYTELRTDNGEVRGMTRQHGRLSFTRVFQSGHEVPAFAPRASYNIFKRVLWNLDVATGMIPIPKFRQSAYSTEGPQDTLAIREPIGQGPPTECYLLAWPWTCSLAQEQKLKNGRASIKDYIVT